MGKRKNQERKKKVALVFDEDKRKEFLCGFRKRKLERKKKAQDELQRLLKEEKKRIKLENKESYKKLVVSSRPIPDIEQLLQDEYEDEEVNVKIVELSSETLQKKDLVIGENRPKEKADKQVKKVKQNAIISEIPGMGTEAENSEASNTEGEDDDGKLKTKKEVKRMLKKEATKKIQKSKVFQMKSKLDRVKNKKKSQQKKGRMQGMSEGKKERANARGKPDSRKDKSKKKVGRRKH